MDTIRRTLRAIRWVSLAWVSACGEGPVEPPPPATLTIEPPGATLDLGFTQQFAAVLRDSAGTPLPSALQPRWTSDDTTVMRVSGDGIAIARGPGTARLRVMLEGLRATAVVTVRPLALWEVAPGYGITCAVTESGLGYCWGENDGGQLGVGTTEWHAIPHPVAGGLRFRMISASADHACGVTSAGEAYCWGWNAAGRLGDGTVGGHRYVPTAVVGWLTFVEVHAGGWFTCGLTPAGEAHCWGDNSRGALGDGTTTSRLTPTPVAGGLTFSSLTAAGLHACGLTADGTAYCWGKNSTGQLGDGTLTDRLAPVRVAGDLRFQSIGTAVGHTCAMSVNGAAYCWGDNYFGRLGDGTEIDRPVPTRVAGGLTFSTVRPGGSHTCGLTVDGAAYCWGYNLVGQLGRPRTELHHSLVPVAVTGGLIFVSLEVGNGHACGQATDGIFYCWGVNVFGQLGVGTLTVGSHVPVPIFGQQ